MHKDSFMKQPYKFNQQLESVAIVHFIDLEGVALFRFLCVFVVYPVRERGMVRTPDRGGGFH